MLEHYRTAGRVHGTRIKHSRKGQIMEDVKEEERLLAIDPDNIVGDPDARASPEFTLWWVEACIVRHTETLARKWEENGRWDDDILAQLFTFGAMHASFSKEGYRYCERRPHPAKIIRGPWKHSSRN